MKLFKKKEPREIKEDDSLLVKLWYNKRTHALLVLGIYFIFLFIIILLSNISIHKNKDSIKQEAREIQKYFTNLDGKPISYNFVITQGENIYYFQGYKNENEINGNLMNNADTLSLNITEEGCKVGSFVNDEFIVNEDIMCPEIITYDLFNYSKIYDVISDKSDIVRKLENCYIYKIDGSEYHICVKGELLSKIDIIKEDITYNLNYNVNALITDEIKSIEE